MEKYYLGVGVVLQMPDQATSEFANVALDLGDIIPKGIQLGDHDLVTVGAAVSVAPGDQRPGHDDHQDSDGSDYLGQPSQVLHVRASPCPSASSESGRPM